MKAIKLLFPILSIILLSTSAHAGKEVDRLLAEYSNIETVSCQIRRTKEGAAGKIKFMSRVYYTNKNQIHAEGITPVKRRTIADGKRLYQYVEGDPKGFSRPIEELSEQMRISLQFVPGTAMDHLLWMKGTEEAVLPGRGDAAKQVGIQTDTKYVLMQFDAADRLSGIEFYKTEAMENKIADYEYRDFIEAAPGAWIPRSHAITVQNEQQNYKELVTVDRFVANQPVAESLFIASSFFDKNIDFVDDFAKIFPE